MVKIEINCPEKIRISTFTEIQNYLARSVPKEVRGDISITNYGMITPFDKKSPEFYDDLHIVIDTGDKKYTPKEMEMVRQATGVLVCKILKATQKLD